MFGNLGCTETKRILELLGKNDKLLKHVKQKSDKINIACGKN